MLAEDRYKLVDLILLGLKDALGNPNHVTDFLLLELDVSVKYSKVKLALKSQLEHLHITLIKGIINALLSASGRVDIPNGRILWEQFQHTTELVFVGDIGQHSSSGWVQVTNSWVETLAVRFAHARLVERSAKGVEGNIDRIGISADTEDLAHKGGGVTSELHDVLVEVLDPELDKRRLDDLNLNFLENLAGITNVGGLLQEHGEVLADGSVNENSLVEVGVPLGAVLECWDTTHGGLLEHTERVALFDELVDITARKGSLEQEHDILNHVLVGDKVKELRKRLDSLGSQVLELNNKL